MNRSLPQVCRRCRKLKMPELGEFRRVPGRCHDYFFVCHACQPPERRLPQHSPSQPSWLERRVVRVLVDAGVRFKREHWIGSRRFDFLVPGLSLIIEADGRSYHGMHRRVTRDAAKERLARSSGYAFARVRDPDVEGKVRAALDLRREELGL